MRASPNQLTDAERAKIAMETIAADERQFIAADERKRRLVNEPESVVSEAIESIETKLKTLPARRVRPGHMSMRDYLANVVLPELLDRPAERIAREIATADRRKQSAAASIALSQEVLHAGGN